MYSNAIHLMLCFIQRSNDSLHPPPLPPSHNRVRGSSEPVRCVCVCDGVCVPAAGVLWEEECKARPWAGHKRGGPLTHY